MTAQQTTLQERQIINDMADAMRRYGDGCTRDQLQLHFTGDQIDAYAERARTLANSLAAA